MKFFSSSFARNDLSESCAVPCAQTTERQRHIRKALGKIAFLVIERESNCYNIIKGIASEYFIFFPSQTKQ